MPETPDKCHHTRWHSSHLPSRARLISQRLGAASVERCGPQRAGYLTGRAVVRDALAFCPPLFPQAHGRF